MSIYRAKASLYLTLSTTKHLPHVHGNILLPLLCAALCLYDSMLQFVHRGSAHSALKWRAEAVALRESTMDRRLVETSSNAAR